MADIQFLSMAGSESRATLIDTQLTVSVLHLFKQGFVPSPNNVLGDFTAQECDYAGYAALTIAQFATPILAPGGGYMTYAPLQTFPWTAGGQNVQNMVGGAYLVTAGGVLQDVVVFETAKPMQGPGQTVQLIPSVSVPTGP